MQKFKIACVFENVIQANLDIQKKNKEAFFRKSKNIMV